MSSVLVRANVAGARAYSERGKLLAVLPARVPLSASGQRVAIVRARGHVTKRIVLTAAEREVLVELRPLPRREAAAGGSSPAADPAGSPAPPLPTRPESPEGGPSGDTPPAKVEPVGPKTTIDPFGG